MRARIDELNKGVLPEGVRISVFYDRTELVQSTLRTVFHNLVEGATLVILVLLVMLGSFRAGVITALAIPLSMLFATSMMQAFGVTASLMSLGAIDFGLIVDSSVIMVENCIHRLSHNTQGRRHVDIIRDAAIEVRKPTMFGELIISIVYLPILMLQGTEGKLFRPMALTVLFALLGSLILSMTFMPAMASLALPRKMQDKDVFLVRWIKWFYRPVVTRAISYPKITALIALSVFAISIPVGQRLGGEFMPRLEEGDLLIEAVRLPSASLEGAITMSQQIEQEVVKFPEVRTVFCKTGRPEIANDVMGVHQTDVWVLLKDHHEWRPGMTRDKLIEELSDVLNRKVPGVAFGFTQPIEKRVDELVAGVKADVAVLLYGDDLNELARISKDIETTLKGIQGAVDVKADYQANLTTITIVPDRDAMAHYGIDARQVMDVVEAMGGRQVGTIFEGRARFPIRVRIPDGRHEPAADARRGDGVPHAVGSLPVHLLDLRPGDRDPGRRGAGGQRLHQRVRGGREARPLLPVVRGDLPHRPDVRGHGRLFPGAGLRLEGDVHRGSDPLGADHSAALADARVAALARRPRPAGPRGRAAQGRRPVRVRPRW